MAADWDPNTPGTIGLGWFPRDITDRSASTTRSLGMFVPSTVTETIAAAYVGIGNVSAAGLACVDVYPAASAVAGAVTTTTVVPESPDITVGTGWQRQNTDVTNLYLSIDDSVINPASYITYLGPYTAANRYEPSYSTGGWAANRRVIGGRMRFAADVQDGTGTLQVWYSGGGTRVHLGTVSLTTNTQSFSIPFGEINPVTSLPWTQADIDNLDSVNSFGFRPLSGAARAIRVYFVDLDIDWVAEARVAASVLALTPTSDLSWETFPLIDPNSGAANWAKAASTGYVVVVRPPVAVGGISAAAFTVRTLDSGLPPPPGVFGLSLLTGSGGRVISFAADDVRTWAMSLAFDVDASATDSADGMPFLWYENSPIISDAPQTGGQEISGAAALSYTLVRFVARTITSTGVPASATAPLTVKVRNRATSVQIGGTGTLTVADFEASPSLGFPPRDSAAVTESETRFCSVTLASPAVLAAATQYELFFESATEAAEVQWVVLALSTSDPAAVTRGNPATYVGTTDVVFSSDSGEIVSGDLAATLSVVPNPVTGFEAYPVQRAITPTGPEIGCGYQTIEDVRLQWNPTTLGADFGYYEIDRTSDGGTTWQTIRHITDEDVDQATDNEAPFNIESSYRIRVIRDGDLIPSAWSDEEHATPTVDGCPVVLSTALHPDRTQVYPRGPVITWNWASYDQQTISSPAGADYQTAVVPSEWRGDVFAPQVSIWSPGFASNPSDPPAPGRAAFDPLNLLLRSTVPYICVRDETGRVWYANVTAAEPSRAEPFHAYTAELVVTELTGTPAVLDQEATILGLATSWWDARAYTGTGLLPDLSGLGNDLTPGAFNHPLDLFGPDDGLPNPRYFSVDTNEASSPPSLMSTPSSASLQIVGDIDLRFRAASTGDLTSGGTADKSVVIRKVVSGSTNLLPVYEACVNENGGLWFGYTVTGGASQEFASDIGNGTLDPYDVNECRITRVAATGTVTGYVRDDNAPTVVTADGKGWRQIGSDPTPPGNMDADAGQLTYMIGKGWGYEAQIFDGIDGTLVCDLDVARDADPGDITFTDLSGHLWTVEGTSAVLSADRVGVAMSENTRFDHADVPSLDIATGAGSLALAFRPFDEVTLGSLYFNKIDGTIGVNSNGWGLVESSGAGGAGAVITDGGTLGVAASTVGFDLADHVLAGVVDRTNQDLIAYLDGAQTASDTDISNVPDLSSTAPVTILSSNGLVLFAAAIWNDRALTAAQEALLVAEMNSPVLPQPSDPFLYEP